MSVDTFLERVKPSRKIPSGDGGYLIPCPCPGHGQGRGNRQPSLSVSSGRDGRVLLKCHAGCPTEDVVAGFGLEMADLMNGHRDDRPQPQRPSTPTKKLEKTYHYLDQDGELVFEVLRYRLSDGSKRFSQRRPDGHGDWIWKLGSDTPRVLYRLPEVVAGVTAGEVIYVAEGEKDVDALVKAGAVATCNPHGAGKWRDEYSECLRDALVIIVRDKDQPGRAHAAKVKASLAGVARQVAIVEARQGKDAYDHLRAGFGLDEWVNADGDDQALDAERSLVEEHPPAHSSGARVVCMADVEPEQVSWLWPGRVPIGKLTILMGDPGLGKTMLSLHIASAVTRGAAFPDGPEAPLGNVVILTAEDGLADTIRPRLDTAHADVTRVYAVEAVRESDAAGERTFSLMRDVEILEEIVRETGAKLVIIDPLDAYLGGVDTHRNAEVRGTLAPLAKMLERTGAAGLMVHHLNKGTSQNALYRAGGSLGFVAAARSVVGVAPDPDTPGRSLLLTVKLNIAAKPMGLGYRITDGGIAWDSEPVDLDAATAFSTRRADSDLTGSAKELIRRELAGGRDVPQVVIEEAAEEAGISMAVINKAKRALGVQSKREGFGKGALWYWHLDTEA